jgi:GT2 family glycosyltransferase
VRCIVKIVSRQIDVTLSIVNTNNRELLRGCLETIRSTVHGSSYEIIVVDNASHDGSYQMLVNEYPEVTTIRNDVMDGYGASHNRAIAKARGEFVLILNEDMEMLDGAIDRMVRRARDIHNLGVMGCRILNPDRSLQHSCFKFPNLRQELFEAVFPYTVSFANSRVRSKMHYWGHDREADVDIVVGCCMLIPKRSLDQVGPFDPGFFVYSEEHDLCTRMRNAGLRVVFNPDSEMIHFGGQTSKRMSLKMALIQVDSRIRYFRKHRGTVATLMFRAILGLGAGIRLVGWSLMCLRPSSKDETAHAKLKEYAASMKRIASRMHQKA